MVPRPLPSVLIIHTGGTLGMDPAASYEPDVDGREKLKRGGSFKGTLGPGEHQPSGYQWWPRKSDTYAVPRFLPQFQILRMVLMIISITRD